MSRAWNETVAALGDLVGGVGPLALISVLAAVLIGGLWYLWPIRIRLRRGGGWRRQRRPAKAKRVTDEPTPQPEPAEEELPDTPAPVLLDLADRLAAEGRFAEAVRERLRAIVVLLVERDVIPVTPGLTVTELAAEAVRARPSLAAAVTEAVGVFSEIWYGQRPAGADDDQRLRRDVDAVRADLSRVGAR